MNKTTKSDFKLFKETCEHYIEFFGLKDWEVFYDHNDHDGGMASCYTNQTGGKNCTMGLSINWECEVTEKQIKKAAFHEVCELLLSETTYELSRYLSDNQVSMHAHNIIRRLENSVFKEFYKNK